MIMDLLSVLLLCPIDYMLYLNIGFTTLTFSCCLLVFSMHETGPLFALFPHPPQEEIYQLSHVNSYELQSMKRIQPFSLFNA